MKLYSYWRSTTSYRVRAALNLKGLAYEQVPIDLLAGDQRSAAYRRLNPAAGVPALELEDGTVLTQSLAIIDYLDHLAEPLLVPRDPMARAQVIAAAHTIALDIHPVNNLKVVNELKTRFGIDGEAVKAWMRHWIAEGFGAFEALISPTSRYAFSEEPDLADICLVAQFYNAERWKVDLAPFPKIQRVASACLAHPAIARAHPNNQPDAKAV